MGIKKRIKGYIGATSGNTLFRIRFPEIDKNHIIKIIRLKALVSCSVANAKVSFLRDLPIGSIGNSKEAQSVQDYDLFPYIRLGDATHNFDLYNNKFEILTLIGAFTQETIELTDDDIDEYIYDSLYFFLYNAGSKVNYFVLEYEVIRKQNVTAQAILISEAIDVVRESTHMEYSKDGGEGVAPVDIPLQR